MPDLKKLLSKFNPKERKAIGFLIEAIIAGSWRNLDVKKLKGYHDIFRVRKGAIRIIFSKSAEGVYIIAIDRRNDNTYCRF